MFFSFEGIDGSGKSTQARLLADALRERGYDVVEVREPGGTKLGEQIRLLLLDPETDVVPRAELLLFIAARAQLVDQVIAPALAEGAVVIADRFADSSVAYQGGGRSLSSDDHRTVEIDDLNDFATHMVSPRRTYLIDLPPSEAVIRRRGRSSPDRMEKDGSPFFERVRSEYRRLATAQPDRVHVLDGTDTAESLHGLILEDALNHL